eukprot:6665315-Lingulodinium_polyedra.AAC.1
MLPVSGEAAETTVHGPRQPGRSFDASRRYASTKSFGSSCSSSRVGVALAEAARFMRDCAVAVTML